MIKLQPPTTQHKQFFNFRCGEILCIGPSTYHVCCALCGQKILYESFPQHFRLEHLSQPEECKLFDKSGKIVKKGESEDASAFVKVEHDPIAHENNENEFIELAQIALFDLDDENDNCNNDAIADTEEDFDNQSPTTTTTWNGKETAVVIAEAGAKKRGPKRNRAKHAVTREPRRSRRRVLDDFQIKVDESMQNEKEDVVAEEAFLTLATEATKVRDKMQLENFQTNDEQKNFNSLEQVDSNRNNHNNITDNEENDQVDKDADNDIDNDGVDNKDDVEEDDEYNSNSIYEMTAPFPCDLCDRRYSSRRGLQYHKRTKHNPNPNNIKNTNNSSKTKKKNATAATSKSSKQAEYKCSDCDLVFRNERALSGHRWKHTGIKCDICGKPFSQTGNMTRHRIRHSGIKSFKCEECDACFYTNKELNSHKICHTGRMPMMCEICGRPCRDRGVLTAHMRRHTGERPAKCDVCGKSFYSFHDLNVHAVSHTSARPFVCDVCGSTFQRKKALRVHKLLHSGQRKYDCKICGKGFAQYGGLNAHLRIHDASAVRAATAIASTDASKTILYNPYSIPDNNEDVICDDPDDLIQEVGDSEIALEETTYTNVENLNSGNENMGTSVATSNVTFIMTAV